MARHLGPVAEPHPGLRAQLAGGERERVLGIETRQVRRGRVAPA
jgi:hypothetical protein